jgi:methyl-accepting chemotaxis protein
MMNATLKISEDMDEMAASAGAVNQAVQEINGGVRETRDSIASLSGEVGKFKVDA